MDLCNGIYLLFVDDMGSISSDYLVSDTEPYYNPDDLILTVDVGQSTSEDQISQAASTLTKEILHRLSLKQKDYSPRSIDVFLHKVNVHGNIFILFTAILSIHQF